VAELLGNKVSMRVVCVGRSLKIGRKVFPRLRKQIMFLNNIKITSWSGFQFQGDMVVVMNLW
jgi:hypothetical protein